MKISVTVTVTSGQSKTGTSSGCSVSVVRLTFAESDHVCEQEASGARCGTEKRGESGITYDLRA